MLKNTHEKRLLDKQRKQRKHRKQRQWHLSIQMSALGWYL